MERGILLGFYTQVSQYDMRWTLSFCTKRISRLIWQLLRICSKGKAMLFSELTSTSQISRKIKYYVFQYNYFPDRENRLLQCKSIVALSGGIQICSYEEQQIGFTSGKWEGASTSASQQQGGKKGWKIAAKMGTLAILAEYSAYL